MSEKLKLEKAPLIKNLFFTDKKPNSYFFIIADMNTKPEKGNLLNNIHSLLEKSRHYSQQCTYG